MLAAVILAAGESRRMGTAKALLPYPASATPAPLGPTFLEHLLAATRHPRISAHRVVLGAHAEEVRRQVALNPGTVVVNAEWRRGQLSSIQVAIRSLPEGTTSGILLWPVDHPLISPQLVALLIERFEATGRPIVVPKFEQRRGHPVIFAATLYPELLAAAPEVGARAVVWAHAAEVLEVATTERGVVLNLNDPEALRQLGGVIT